MYSNSTVMEVEITSMLALVDDCDLWTRGKEEQGGEEEVEKTSYWSTVLSFVRGIFPGMCK